MNRLIFLVLVCLASVNCADVTSPARATYPLTVVNGYGSGVYEPGQIVHVWAGVRPWAEIATGWAGGADLLDRPDEWHTTLVMPDHDVTLKAQIEPLDVTFEEATYKGVTQKNKSILNFIPDAPRGLVFMLHGTSGSASMIEKVEAHYVALWLISRGYGVLSTEAEEVVAGDLNNDGKIRWNPALTSDNVDLANLNWLVEDLHERGIVDVNVPLFALGMSNGGAMSVSLGAVAASSVADEYPNLRFSAVVSYCAAGRPDAAAITTTPTGWLLCANDDNPQVSKERALQNMHVLRERGIATFLDEHAASPLYDHRFMRVPGIDEATSVAIATELRTAGFVDGNGMFVLPTTEIGARVRANPGDYPAITGLSGRARSEVVAQIRVMQAEHQMYSDWASRTANFFAATHAQ